MDSNQGCHQGMHISIIISSLISTKSNKLIVKVSAKDKNIDVSEVIYLDDYAPAQVPTINKIARNSYQNTRSKFPYTDDGFVPYNNPRFAHWFLFMASVYLFIGQHVALVHFVRALYGIKQLKNGDYMVISIDDFIIDPESNVQKYSSAPDPYQSAMKKDDTIQAFRSVLKVTYSYPRNPDFK
jgi:guanylate cyclase